MWHSCCSSNPPLGPLSQATSLSQETCQAGCLLMHGVIRPPYTGWHIPGNDYGCETLTSRSS